MPERLQKILSAAGIASRRTAETLIAQGRVTVNGRTVTEPGTKASLEDDDIRVDDRRVKGVQRRRYILLYKPRGYITTRSDPERRLIKTVGRKQVVGRPFMYSTTREFLERFGLSDLSDLPKVEELSEALGFDLPGGLSEPSATATALPFETEPAGVAPSDEPAPMDDVAPAAEAAPEEEKVH